MAATYTNTPMSISDIFAAIVAEVAVNLGIAIKFKFGTWVVVQDELISDSKSTDNDVKNWANCIALIHDIDEKPNGFTAETITPRIVIVTKSEATWKSQKRNDDSYIPTLYPMWAELGQVIANSSYFLGYNTNVLPKRDLYHIGNETADGKDGYKLPKVLDGLIIEGLNLTLNLQPMCAYVAPNLCLLTPCQYGLEVYDYTIFENVTFAGFGTSIITASVNSYAHLYGGGGLPPFFLPEIDFQGIGAYVDMDVAVPGVAPFTKSVNVAAFLDGFYLGVIRYGDARIEFYYKVVNGVIDKITSAIAQDIEFSVACADFPAYPTTISTHITWLKAATESFTMVGYTLTVFGVQKYTEAFAAVNTYAKTTVTTLAHMAVNDTITNSFAYGSQLPLVQTSQYKTRCKTTF